MTNISITKKRFLCLKPKTPQHNTMAIKKQYFQPIDTPIVPLALHFIYFIDVYLKSYSIQYYFTSFRSKCQQQCSFPIIFYYNCTCGLNDIKYLYFNF